MKKFINVLAVVLALVMCLGIVVACGGGEDEAGEGNTATTTTAGKTTPKVTTPGVTTPGVTTPEVTTTADPEEGRNGTSTVAVPESGNITTPAELQAVLNEGASDKDYTVTATELDMAGLKWTGLKDYSGTFDFGNCKIKNAASSLFISVKNGTVKNLVLADSLYVYLNAKAKEDVNAKTGATGNIIYSPIIRYATNVTISDVVVESSVKIITGIWTEASYTAGVVGLAEGTEVLVENCEFHGFIKTDSNKVYGCAGIAGEIASSDKASLNTEDNSASTALIINCVNTGTIRNLGYGTDSKVGGIIGRLMNAAAVRCTNSGTVFSNDGGQTAGVVAYMGNASAIDKCLNVGEVTGGTGFVGGILGYSNGNERWISNSVNLGKVTAQNSQNLGALGLIKNAEIITNVFNLSTAAIFATNNASPQAAVDPNNNATWVASDGKTLIITNSANCETVDAIYTAIEAAAPGVFVKDNGSLKLA